MSEITKIALLGTGLMGFPMTQNLLKAGYEVTVWNRSMAKAEPLVRDGAILASSPAEAVLGKDFVITMLSDGAAVGALIADANVQSALNKGAIWLDMSSIKPAEAREHVEVLASIGVGHLDAPVSGGTKGAEAASLAIMVGGKATAFATAEPIFAAMGRPVHVGPTGAGQLSKLANQTIVAVTIGAVAEAMLLAEQGGADPAALRKALKGGFADSVILQQHGERMSTGNFAPGGLSKFQLKDLDNVLAEASGLDLTLPVTQHIRDRFDHFVHEMDGADMDHSGLYLELKKQNGMDI
ncbi:oxidoreductase [Rhodobacterales bacterium HTCC2150]|nr:oxidoreductase [Rhodobacterales bacterium HTCC2150] [Rhodobacteraceae bacterium HTCC2150]